MAQKNILKKGEALSKRIKISEAQQHMLLATVGTAILLGAAIAAIINFANKISFNVGVISEEEKAMAVYTAEDMHDGIRFLEQQNG